MKLLTFAHRGEAQAFLAAFVFKPVEFFFDGLLKSDEYYLLITGEGPHTASEKTITVLAKFNEEITEVLNIGVAGSLTNKLKKQDLVWVRTAYAHHAERLEFKSFSSLNPKDMKSPNDCMTAFSRMLSNEEKKKLSHFASLVDRELWAVASAANLFKIPFRALKIISDDLTPTEADICKFVKEEAPLFSEKLLTEFKTTETETEALKVLPIEKENIFLSDKAFYFTTSQERKLQSMLEGLKLKGISPESLMKNESIQKIKETEKSPKDKTRLLLLFLGDQLNPIAVKIRASLEEILSPLSDAKITSTFDSAFEDDWLNLSVRIQSSRDLEKVKNSLKIFSYEDFKKILDGQFDV